MIDTLITVVKALGSSVQAVRQLGDQRREKLASLCDAVAGVLEKYLEAGPDRRRSLNLCAELREYVTPIREVASGTMDTAEVERVADELNRVCDAWGGVGAAGEAGPASYEDRLDQIAEGAGAFRGLAGALRAR